VGRLVEVIRSYRDLKVWQEAMDIAVACYRLTRAFPRDEMYGMISQIRRSSASVAANIAEGYGRDSTGAYINFLKTAQGSLKELETHLLLSERVDLAPRDAIQPIVARCDSAGRMLRSLIRNLQSGDVQ
jgi:four helix bundle protein